MPMRLLIAFSFVLALCGQGTPQTPASVPAEAADQKPATVSGKIVSNTGQAIKKATLTLRWVGNVGSGQMPNPYTASSDAEGKFVFEAVDPGRYMLSADRPGFQRQTYGARQPNSAGTVLTLSAGKSMSDLNLALQPQIVISGKVLDSDGDPVPRAQVRASRSLFFNGKRQVIPTGFASTDENGEYKIQNLGPGKYYVSGAAPRDGLFGQPSRSAAAPLPGGQPAKQEEANVQTYYPGVTDPTQATLVELTPGHDRPGTDITIRKLPVFHLRGSVTGALTGDRTQFRVVVMPRSSAFPDFGLGASAPISKDGTFDLAQVPAGGYSLMLLNAMGMFKLFGSIPVDVGTRDLDDLKITAESPFDLNGKVTKPKTSDTASDATKPKTSAATGPTRIGLQNFEGLTLNAPNTATKDDDSFTLSATASGRYRVSVYSMPDGMYLKGIRYEDQDVLQNGLNLTPGGGTALLEVTLGANAASLEGTVQGADGKPSPSVTVTLIPDPPAPERSDLYKQSNTDQNGHFLMKSIAPGKYRAYAWTDLEQGNQMDPDFIKKYETKGTKLDIAESGSPQITLTPVEP